MSEGFVFRFVKNKVLEHAQKHFVFQTYLKGEGEEQIAGYRFL